MKAKVGLVFSVMPREVATWPYKGFDYGARVAYLSRAIKESIPDVEWVELVAKSSAEFKELPGVGSYAVVIVGIWNGVPMRVAETGKPTLLIDDLYGGSGEFLLTLAAAAKKGLKVAGVASSNFFDVIRALRALAAVDMLARSKLLVVREMGEGAFERLSKLVGERVGTTLVHVKPEELMAEYERVSESEAEPVAQRWISRALAVVEPSPSEILKSARMYLAMKRLLEKHGAQGITIDCLGLFYDGKLPAYPCLGFVELLNQGFVAACEADVDSALTQMLIQYATGRPGFISDPVIDLGSHWIVYAHCLAATRVYGPQGPEVLYKIRTHAEDRAGASLQAYWPVGEPVTTFKLNVAEEAAAIHSGVIAANVEEEKACRTKVATVTNVEKMLDNWNKEANFGWHRVSVVGDFRRELVTAAKLLGFRVFEEDR